MIKACIREKDQQLCIRDLEAEVKRLKVENALYLANKGRLELQIFTQTTRIETLTSALQVARDALAVSERNNPDKVLVTTYSEAIATIDGVLTLELSPNQQSEDKHILELALREMSLALNALIVECSDNEGKPKQPSRQAVMRSRGLLPPYCDQSLAKKTPNAVGQE